MNDDDDDENVSDKNINRNCVSTYLSHHLRKYELMIYVEGNVNFYHQFWFIPTLVFN